MSDFEPIKAWGQPCFSFKVRWKVTEIIISAQLWNFWYLIIRLSQITLRRVYSEIYQILAQGCSHCIFHQSLLRYFITQESQKPPHKYTVKIKTGGIKTPPVSVVISIADNNSISIIRYSLIRYRLYHRLPLCGLIRFRHQTYRLSTQYLLCRFLLSCLLTSFRQSYLRQMTE